MCMYVYIYIYIHIYIYIYIVQTNIKKGLPMQSEGCCKESNITCIMHEETCSMSKEAYEKGATKVPVRRVERQPHDVKYQLHNAKRDL